MKNAFNSFKYQKFKKSVLDYGHPYINIDELYMLINRLTYSDRKIYFGYSKNARFNSRLKYHRHFLIMLEGEGIIEQVPDLIQVWKINK